jgi:hypothetical protein
MAKQINLPVFDHTNPDDDEERLVITMNGKEIASLNHDQHGWEGMEVARNLIDAIEKQLKTEAKKSGK